MTWEMHNSQNGIKEYKVPRNCTLFCNDTNTHQEDTLKVGEEALLCVYNESAKDDLDSLRYERYSEKVKKFSNAVEAYNLPPTSAATRYHSLRVYFQANEENGKK